MVWKEICTGTPVSPYKACQMPQGPPGYRVPGAEGWLRGISLTILPSRVPFSPATILLHTTEMT